MCPSESTGCSDASPLEGAIVELQRFSGYMKCCSPAIWSLVF